MTLCDFNYYKDDITIIGCTINKIFNKINQDTPGRIFVFTINGRAVTSTPPHIVDWHFGAFYVDKNGHCQDWGYDVPGVDTSIFQRLVSDIKL